MLLNDVFHLTERFADRTAELQPWRDDPNIYVSFTRLPKVGINPQSQWNTPLGVYAYPLREMYALIAENDIPYAGKEPYIQVLRANKVTELSRYSEGDLRRDIAKLHARYVEDLCDGCLWDMRHPQNPAFDDIRGAVKTFVDELERNTTDHSVIYDKTFQFAMDFWADEARHPNYPGSKLWNITRNMAGMMTERRPIIRQGAMAPAQPSSVKWNGVLRFLGYSAFSDKTGIGIIHGNEPISTVFLTSAAFSHVTTVRNVIKR